MTAPAPTVKKCIKCGVDCSGKPRTKDAQGRYTCKACVDAAAKAVAKSVKTAKPAAAPPEDADVMAALLTDSPGVSAEMCPSCGNGMPGGAVVCTLCGYNKQTGQTMGVHVQKGPGKAATAATAALGAASAVGGLAAGPMALILATVGAVIGGVIGGGIWAAITYTTHREIGWIAWGVGGLVGAGASLGARGHAGLITGVIALVVAFVSVTGGKWAAFSMIVDDLASNRKNLPRLTETDMIAMSAHAVHEEFAAQGKNYAWPNGVEPEEADEEGEFAAPVWAEAKSRWEANDQETRDSILRQAQSGYQTAAAEEFKANNFGAMFSVFDVLFYGLALFTAFKLGASSFGSSD